MQIEYKSSSGNANVLGCWLVGILTLVVVIAIIGFVFNFLFVAFPLIGFALIAYWIFVGIRKRKRREAMMADYEQQYEEYYQQQTNQQTPPTSVIDADYRVVDSEDDKHDE
ncbi:MAG: hypothetical protein ACRCWD_02630 [Culicoidibacterales bacterium]